jgi:2-phospho-L-lactate guanylyltransferase
MAEDTVAAALRCSLVSRVVVVTDEPIAADRMRSLGAVVVADLPDAGLNPALAHGAREAVAVAPGAAVAALASDLPALRPEALAAALTSAAAHPSAVVADAGGDGTTLLAADEVAHFAPRFGPMSRRAHVVAGAVDVTDSAPDVVRRDVDTVDDLRAALSLGCGPATTAAIEQVALLR